MHLVTVATHSERYFPYLLKSCERFGEKLVVLGWGEAWGGFMMRFKLISKFLDNLHDNDIVCFIDAYDVILLRPFSELEEKFRKTGSQVAVSADIWISRVYFGSCKGETLNAGSYIGYVKTLKKIINTICNDYDCSDKKLDDQKILTEYCNKNSIYIDKKCDMFYMLNHFYNNYNIINHDLIYKNETPCILHGPGNINMDKILIKLGYDVPEPTERHKTQYILNLIVHHQEKTSIFLLLLIIIIFTMLLIQRGLRRHK